MTTEREFKKIQELMEEAYISGLHRKAADIAHRGAEQARAAGQHLWRIRFLFWEGENLQCNGERSAAQIPLLEAARPEAEADPADQYNALTTLIEIGLADKDATWCRRLLAQGHAYLESIHKTPWRHKLDFLEGALEARRGEWPQAQGCYRRAWEFKPQHRAYPGFTTATHLLQLVYTAFQQQQLAELGHWQGELEGCDKVLETDRLKEQYGHLLHWRAQRASGEAGLETNSTVTTAALQLLRHKQGLELQDNGFSRNPLRVLLLTGHWAALDDWLARLHWQSDSFEDALFRGDERLARARHALQLPPRDEEWLPTVIEHTKPTLPTASQNEQARALLHQAREHYQANADTARKEDQRLETQYYTNTLNQRLERVAELEGLLPSQ